MFPRKPTFSNRVNLRLKAHFSRGWGSSGGEGGLSTSLSSGVAWYLELITSKHIFARYISLIINLINELYNTIISLGPLTFSNWMNSVLLKAQIADSWGRKLLQDTCPVFFKSRFWANTVDWHTEYPELKRTKQGQQMGKRKGRMLLKSVGKGGRRLLRSLLERSKLAYLKAGWGRSGANMLAAGLEKAADLAD